MDGVGLKPNRYKDITATTDAVKSGQGVLVGMYVNSTSAGTIKFEDTLTHGSGTVINNTITPAIGWHTFGGAGGANFTTGLSATIGGTLDVTLYYR